MSFSNVKGGESSFEAEMFVVDVVRGFLPPLPKGGEGEKVSPNNMVVG